MINLKLHDWEESLIQTALGNLSLKPTSILLTYFLLEKNFTDNLLRDIKISSG